MADKYIRLQDAQDILEKAIDDDWEKDYAIDRLGEIQAADVDDVQRVVRGTWIGIDEFPHEDWECSICGGQVCGNDSIPQDMNFCPNCGADMRETNNGCLY